jgi:hypothetical protein
VQYLREVGFRGNLMVHFNVGAFVTWKLYPDVKVSMDGRYEVAYPPEALAENLDFYAAEPGWEQTLDKYPTDAVLVPTPMPVCTAIEDIDGWTRVYCDDTFEVYARRGLPLPVVDRRGQRFTGTFP